MQKIAIVFNIAAAIMLNSILNYAICDLNLYTEVSLLGKLISIVVMCLLFTLLTAIFKKSNKAVIAISVIIFILTIINNIKFYYTFNPIYFSDIYFLKNIGELSGLVRFDIFLHLYYLRFFFLIAIMLSMVFITTLYGVEFKKGKTRIVTIIVCLLLLTLLFIPIRSKDKFLLGNVYAPEKRKDYKAMINNLEYYRKYGVIAGMYGIQLEDRPIEPNNYDEKKIEELINSYSSMNENPSTSDAITYPNIIVMFQESYWDIEKLSEIKFDKNVTENIDLLKQLSNHSNMLSASYGGLSSNIEFELLTGGNLAFFSKGYNPFMQMYRKNISEKNPSIIKELKKNKYKTKMVFGRDYYFSGSVYKKLGIDEYVNEFADRKDYKDHIKGNYISDHALVDDALNELKNKSHDKSLFYMTATIQSHMPFYKEKYDNYDIAIKESTLSDNEKDVILSYSQGVYDTGIELMRLYREIQKIDDPTIVIVILGDHLPYLYNDKGEDILLKSEYFNTPDEKENLLRKYTTEVLTFSNYEYVPDFKYDYISPDYILTKVINDLNMNISPFYKITNETHNKISALNQYLLIDSDMEKYYTTDSFNKEIQDIYNLRESLQYYFFRKNN